MSKKHPSHAARPAHPEIRARIERTRQEGRYQQALELVKQLYKYEPTPKNLELLKDTYLQRARQLRGMGNLRDAATVVEVASRLDSANRGWLETLAQEAAQCGDASRLQALLAQLARLPAPVQGADATSSALLAALADAAFLQEKNGRAALSPELRTEYDAIVQAFREVESGQDEAAKATLQAIGLRSPFLEWKVLLRGFQAYYAGDDERARENWQRLDPGRLPARLAAPFRAATDPEYLRAQPAPVQTRLRQQFESTQGSDLGVSLRALERAAEHGESLGEALRQAERLLPGLRATAPHLVSRLATYFYWRILDTGPGDMTRFRRVFGAPPDDPHLNRLNALGYERGDLEEAHRYWQQFERDVANLPNVWPGEQGILARTLIWMRMGDNALKVPSAAQVKKLPRAIRQLEEIPDPLKPSAEECFRHAVELSPDMAEAHLGLLKARLEAEQNARAIKAGEALVAQFPDHAEGLRLLGTLLVKEKHYQRACEVFEQAVRLQPLDRELQGQLAGAYASRARELAQEKRYDDARPLYRRALERTGGEQRHSVLIRWAVVERLAGDSARADELLAEARTAVGELYVSYLLLVEAHRMSLSGKEKTQHAKEFTAKLDEPADANTVLELLEYATALQRGDVTYTGQKTHVKKIVSLAGKLDPMALTEEQLRRACTVLVEHEGIGRFIRRFFAAGERRFPDNPHFPYLEAVYLMGDEPDENLRDYMVRGPLERAARLARKRPPDEPGIKPLLADVERRLSLLRMLNPFADIFSRMFGGPDDFDNGDDLE